MGVREQCPGGGPPEADDFSCNERHKATNYSVFKMCKDSLDCGERSSAMTHTRSAQTVCPIDICCPLVVVDGRADCHSVMEMDHFHGGKAVCTNIGPMAHQ